MDMIEPISKTSIVAHGGLALFGAVVHAAKAHRSGNSKTFVDFTILTTMSSFSGVMFALVGFQFFADQAYLTMAMAGTGGFLGVEGMTIIVDRLKKVISK